MVNKVVFMGMGEPLDNYRAVLGALKVRSILVILVRWSVQRKPHWHESAKCGSSGAYTTIKHTMVAPPTVAIEAAPSPANGHFDGL